MTQFKKAVYWIISSIKLAKFQCNISRLQNNYHYSQNFYPSVNRKKNINRYIKGNNFILPKYSPNSPQFIFQVSLKLVQTIIYFNLDPNIITQIKLPNMSVPTSKMFCKSYYKFGIK